MDAINKHITPYTFAKRMNSSMLMPCLLFCLIIFSLSINAQEERGLTRDGNKLFNKQKYADAEAAYKKALEKKNNFPEAIFNLGDAMYKQERYDDAIAQYELAAKTLTDPKLKAQVYHNNGNCQLEKKEWEKAVDAYKQALKLNPNDKDTRYNLAYANEKLREKQKQDQQNKNNKNDKKDNKDQKKDQKDQDKKDDKGNDKKDDKGQKDKDKEGQGDKDKQKKQGEQPKLSKEQAEKLLEALKAEEQKAQDKMQKKTAKPVDVKVEKDW
jgi:tetratricopeptide (TPR) repeat protein